MLDEAEPEELQIVLRTLRSAAGGAGQRWRASPNGSGIDVQISRFCALLMGTATPRLGRADESRLSPVAFGPPVDDWPTVETRIRGSLRILGPAVRSRIIRDAPKTVAHADTIAEHERGRGIDSREAAASGALTAGWCAWQADQVMVPAGVVNEARSDAADCLREILELTARIGSTEFSLWRLLRSSSAEDTKQAADTFGVRRDGGDLLIAYRHTGLARRLRGSRWQSYRLDKLLEQLPGIGGRAQVRIGDRREQAIRVPEAALAAQGFCFDDDRLL